MASVPSKAESSNNCKKVTLKSFAMLCMDLLSIADTFTWQGMIFMEESIKCWEGVTASLESLTLVRECALLWAWVASVWLLFHCYSNLPRLINGAIITMRRKSQRFAFAIHSFCTSTVGNHIALIRSRNISFVVMLLSLLVRKSNITHGSSFAFTISDFLTMVWLCLRYWLPWCMCTFCT